MKKSLLLIAILAFVSTAAAVPTNAKMAINKRLFFITFFVLKLYN